MRTLALATWLRDREHDEDALKVVVRAQDDRCCELSNPWTLAKRWSPDVDLGCDTSSFLEVTDVHDRTAPVLDCLTKQHHFVRVSRVRPLKDSRDTRLGVDNILAKHASS